MKRIEVRRSEDGVIRVYATNDNGEGLFTRGELQGAYSQVRGNGQFHTRARTGKQFAAHLHKRNMIGADDEIVAEHGWQ